MPSWVPESWKDSSRRAAHHGAGPAVALGGGALGVRPVDGDQAEFGGHEEAVGEDQKECRAEQQEWMVMMPPPPGRGRRRYYRTIRPLLEGVTPRVAGAPRPVVPACAGRGALGAADIRVIKMVPGGAGAQPLS